MRITPAERRALEAVSLHGTAKSAAHAIGRSPRTVEHHLASVRHRLNVDTTIQAVRLVFDLGK